MKVPFAKGFGVPAGVAWMLGGSLAAAWLSFLVI
jgi:hypothetical protein